MAVIDWSNWPNRMAKQRSQPLTDIVRPRDPAKFHRKVLKARAVSELSESWGIPKSAVF
jgi:hypothetical protein